MINEELYNLLKALNKKYKYIGYDRGSENIGMIYISSKKLKINDGGYFDNLWKHNYAIILTDIFPCLSSLFDGEAKLYKIDGLLKEWLEK